MIGSGYRTREENEAVGGATNSQHLLGSAADFQLEGLSHRETALALEVDKEARLEAGIREIYHSPGSMHPEHTHVDCCHNGESLRELPKRTLDQKKPEYAPLTDLYKP
jgi:hypothetical protein